MYLVIIGKYCNIYGLFVFHFIGFIDNLTFFYYLKCSHQRLLTVSATSGEENVTSFCSIKHVLSCTRDLDVLGKEIAPLYNATELDSLCR